MSSPPGGERCLSPLDRAAQEWNDTSSPLQHQVCFFGAGIFFNLLLKETFEIKCLR
jgi:hypothetical protein